ncbi:acyltransferase [Leptospira yasudae]|uniref:acyltransferase n=1 Tax=Leptospira yasudae TaxID=2202201 RepID=UPI00298F597E|nr:acyltransferase [Leptospira yasudae]
MAKTCSLSVGGGKSNLVIEDGVAFGDFCKVSAADGSSLKIKEKTSFYSHATLSGDIEIGTNCLFGPNVTVLSGTHNINGRKLIRDLDREYIEKNGNVYSEKIQIGDDCWLGVNSVILPGVTLGKGCVVGANSVVTKSFEDYAVIGGIPAKLLKYRPE